MRRGRGGGKSVGCGLALCATWACSGPVQLQEQHVVPATVCVLTDTPSITADSATIAFDALGVAREQCALTLATETLHPWPNAPTQPWTVHITITPTAATVRPLAGDDARNAVDAGSPLLATDDLGLTAYAAARADLDVTPLPWNRTYVQLSRAPLMLGASVGPDAVRADARRAEAPACEMGSTDVTIDARRVASRRVVYDVGDRTARELAERIVALLEVANATAVGLSAAELDTALQIGSELAYVVSVPRASYCQALVALVLRAPWANSQSVLPLIETRPYGIAPRAPGR